MWTQQEVTAQRTCMQTHTLHACVQMHTNICAAECMAGLCWVWDDCCLTQEAHRYGADSSLVIHIVHATGGASDSYIGCITHIYLVRSFLSAAIQPFETSLTAMLHALHCSTRCDSDWKQYKDALLNAQSKWAGRQAGKSQLDTCALTHRQTERQTDAAGHPATASSKLLMASSRSKRFSRQVPIHISRLADCIHERIIFCFVVRRSGRWA